MEDVYILPPTITNVEVISPFSAKVSFTLPEEILHCQQEKKSRRDHRLLQGFIVGIRRRRRRAVLPDLRHIEREIFLPLDTITSKNQNDQNDQNDLNNQNNQNVFELTVPHLLPDQTYTLYVCCLFSEGRGAIAKTSKFKTPKNTEMNSYIWIPICAKIHKYVYSSIFDMMTIEDIHHIEDTQVDHSKRDKKDAVVFSMDYQRMIDYSDNSTAFNMKNNDKDGDQNQHDNQGNIKIARSTPLTASELKELEEYDMILNTQKRE